eukprot:TRINITY_DN30553_c0_g1_i1.p1 TRINITY_DN30553_c0_g1~~TRINITY_DN30553_c0_g1_i1.p1  ORF type:complete len:493 (+),score=45.56 TRINITY_DN30553_c0_g1_i1:115-1479(+)
MVLFREWPPGPDDPGLRKVLQPFELVRTSLSRSGIQINWAGGLEDGGKVVYQTYPSNNISLLITETGDIDHRVCKSLLHLVYETLLLFTGNVDFCTSDRELSSIIANNTRRSGGAISGILKGFSEGSIRLSPLIMSHRISLLSKTDYIKIERMLDDIVGDGNTVQMSCLLCTTHNSIVSRLFGYHPAVKFNINLLHWLLSIIVPSLPVATIRDIPVFIPLVDGRSEPMRLVMVKLDKHTMIINLCPQDSRASADEVAAICCNKFKGLLKSKWGLSVSRSLFYDCDKLPAVDKVKIPTDLNSLAIFCLPTAVQIGHKYDSCNGFYWSLPLVNELNEVVDSTEVKSSSYVILGADCSEEMLSMTALQLIDLLNQPIPTVDVLAPEKQPVVTSGCFDFNERTSCVWTLLPQSDLSNCMVAAGYASPSLVNQRAMVAQITEFALKNKKLLKSLDESAT